MTPTQTAQVREALDQALRQWKMYSEIQCGEAEDLDAASHPEAQLYRKCNVALTILYATPRPAENLTQDCGNVRNAGEVLHSDAALQAADRISQILEDQQCGVWVGSNEAHTAIEAYRAARQQMKDQLSRRWPPHPTYIRDGGTQCGKQYTT